MNTIDRTRKAKLLDLVGKGFSYRKVSYLVGVAIDTVRKYARTIEKTGPKGDIYCDNCKVRPIPKDSEYRRKSRRFKHKFCSHYCYGEFIKKRNAKDSCKRCGIKREEKLCMTITRGYCPYCYGLLREFNWREDLVDVHEARIELKEAIRESKEYK